MIVPLMGFFSHKKKRTIINTGAFLTPEMQRLTIAAQSPLRMNSCPLSDWPIESSHDDDDGSQSELEGDGE